MKKLFVAVSCLFLLSLFVSCGGGSDYGIKEFAQIMKKANEDFKKVTNAKELAQVTRTLNDDLMAIAPKLKKLKTDFPGFFSNGPDMQNLPAGVTEEDVSNLLNQIDMFNKEFRPNPEWMNDPEVAAIGDEFEKLYAEIF
jgi:hypothetical protein